MSQPHQPHSLRLAPLSNHPHKLLSHPQDLPWPELPEEVTKAFDVAYANIKAFHEAQRGPDVSVETMPGVTCRRVTRPINAVGLYVPGGTAVLPSSALMLAVPAQIAGAWGGRGAITAAAAARQMGQHVCWQHACWVLGHHTNLVAGMNCSHSKAPPLQHGSG